MPIGGFVINIVPDALDEVLTNLATLSEVEIHGHDKKGSLVATIIKFLLQIFQKVRIQCSII